jgi:hypothetical protein
LGAYVGEAAGLSAGVAATTLLAIPGIGQVFALAFGAAALLGLVGAGTGSAVGAKAASTDASSPAPDKNPSADSTFFRQVLEQGHSLIVARTESEEVSASACQILDRLGMSMKKGLSQKSRLATRELGKVVALDVVRMNCRCRWHRNGP